MQQLLADGEEGLFAAVEGVGEDEAHFKAAPERWSIVEIVEHVMVAEERMLDWATAGSTPAEGPSDTSRDSKLIRLAHNRGRRFEAPKGAAPTGRFATLAAALEAFRASRERSRAYVDSTTEDLRSRTAPHAIGPVDAHQCLILLARHPMRHAAQIREAREGYRQPSPSAAE